jgi:hypothetical protein
MQQPRMPERIRNTVYSGCLKFFRIRLLTSSPERIAKIVENYDKETRAIKDDIFKMCWYMRGGLTYEEALNLSFSERESVGALIKDNLETTKKTGMAFF